MNPQQIGEGTLTQEQLIYKENILDHYKYPRNKRTMEHPQVHTHNANPLCGDTIEVFAKIEHGIIVDISYTGKGCAISQAAMSMLTEQLKGAPMQDALAMHREEITEMLGIPIGVVRMKCAMLGLRALQEGIRGMNK
jgi:nitrogen fixation NifU-like protein